MHQQAMMDRRGVIKMSVTGAATAMLLGARIDGGRAFAAESGESSSAQSYTPGTYSAEAEGKGGTVVVEAAFSRDAIESVEVVSHEETMFLSDMAIERIPQLIVEKQSLGIDTITGATLTSSAIIGAVADCAGQAGGDVDALKAVPAGEEPGEAETVEIDADVVIVGAGAAGMAAAVAAAQSGAQKVVVLEKTSNMGGNALVSGGWLRFIYAPQELRPEMTDGYVEYFDSLLQQAEDGGVDSGLLDWIRADYDAYYVEGYQTTYASNQLNNLELRVVNQLGFEGYTDTTTDIPYDERYEKSQDTRTKLNRWLDSMGIEWIPIEAIVGYPWPQWSGVKGQHCGDGYFSLFSKEIEAESLPIELIPLTPASEIIKDEYGKVAGLKGVNDDGTTYIVHASKATIIATGGFSGNPEMLRQYDSMWDFPEGYIPTTNAYGHTGDGIVMAQALGASTKLMDQEMLFPFADFKNWSTETIVGETGGCLFVNESGERFVNEVGSRFDICRALFKQPDCKGFIISDADNCSIADGVNQFGVTEDFLIDRGQLFKADTIEELAELAGIDPATLVATVEKYNKCVEAGIDEEYGRTVFTATTAVDTPPFYASPRTWAAHITTGGLVVDTDYCVLDESGARIEGLYAAGEVVCGLSGVGVLGNGMECAQMLYQ